MEHKVGEVFDYNGVTLTTIEGNGCKGCFFYNTSRNICTMDSAKVLFCSKVCRKDNKNVIFKEMETRTIKLTLEKAKEFYKKGGEFRDLALSAYTEEELIKAELPKTWEEFCSNYKVQNGEYYIGPDSVIRQAPLNNFRLPCGDSNILPNKQAAEAHLALMQLHQLRDCYRQGWKPDWEKKETKWCIDKRKIYPIITSSFSYSSFLSFQSKEIAELFLDNFRGLIEEAGDLI